MTETKVEMFERGKRKINLSERLGLENAPQAAAMRSGNEK
jgi:hypothetical protein